MDNGESSGQPDSAANAPETRSAETPKKAVECPCIQVATQDAGQEHKGLLWIALAVVAAIVHFLLPFPYHQYVSPYLLFLGIVLSIFTMVKLNWEHNKRTRQSGSSTDGHLLRLFAIITILFPTLRMISDYKIKAFNAITRVSGTINLVFDRPVDRSRLRTSGQESSDYDLIQIFKNSFTNTADERGHFLIDKITYKKFADLPSESPLTYGAVIRFSGEDSMFSTGLSTVSAKDFFSKFDFLCASPFVQIPGGATYRGMLTMSLNGEPQHFVDIPMHYPSAVAVIIIPLNEHARATLREYRLFDPKHGTLLHYHEVK